MIKKYLSWMGKKQQIVSICRDVWCITDMLNRVNAFVVWENRVCVPNEMQIVSFCVRQSYQCWNVVKSNRWPHTWILKPCSETTVISSDGIPMAQYFKGHFVSHWRLPVFRTCRHAGSYRRQVRWPLIGWCSLSQDLQFGVKVSVGCRSHSNLFYA